MTVSERCPNGWACKRACRCHALRPQDLERDLAAHRQIETRVVRDEATHGAVPLDYPFRDEYDEMMGPAVQVECCREMFTPETWREHVEEAGPGRWHTYRTRYRWSGLIVPSSCIGSFERRA